MILSDIKRYLIERKQASLLDISTHFDSDVNAVRGMLSVWEKKGKVKKLSATASCGSGCDKCDPASVEIYLWLGTEHNDTSRATTLPICKI